MIKYSTWKRRNRKIKPYGDQGKGINRGFCFGDQDTIESVIMFRVDGHTIKMGFLTRQFGHPVPLGVGLHALHLDLVHIGEQAKIFIKNVLRNANLALTCFEKTL
jgi:hypothetical protein